MSQTLSLYRLQQVDSQIDRIQSRLLMIHKIMEDDADLRLANEQAASTKTIYQSAEEALKQAEAAAQNQRIKIEQIESSLYSDKGHSPKELLDLQNDLSALKRHLITLEDVQLEAMLDMERSTMVDQAAQAGLQVAKERSTDQNREFNEEQLFLQKELEKHYAERVAVAGPIPADVLSLYDRLRQQRRGIAVAVISERACSACGAGLSAAQIQSSRASGSMALCPSCGRILYGN